MATREQTAVLQYAVRPRVILTFVGQLSLILGVLSLIPILVSLWFGEYRMSLAYLAVVVVLLVIGIPGLYPSGVESLQVNEGLVITSLTFLLAAIVMSYPFVQSGLPLADALFEAVSAITTTGLSTLESVEHLPRTILFARAWMQWIGGLGIVVLSVALLLGRGMIARRLAASESAADNLVATTRTHARRMLAGYAVLTVMGVLMLWLLGVEGWTAVTHVLSAVSTGGFSSFDENLAAFPWWAPRVGLMALAFCGALALPLYYRTTQEGWRPLLNDLEFRALLTAALITSGLLAVLWHESTTSWSDHLGHTLLVGFSAQTGTGFTTLTIADLSAGGKVLLLGSMLIGGSLGSTSGGIKVWRMVLLVRMIQFAIRRTALPRHAVAELRIAGRRIEEDEAGRALIVIMLFGLVIAISWVPFVALGFDPLNALFDVCSATATVGLSTGIVDQSLPAALKFLLCADMLLGRLEILAFLVVCYPATWIGKRTGSS